MTHPSRAVELNTFLLSLPTDPGVYRMLDENGHVLYVGKASNLKKRVSSYFSKQEVSPKTRSLVSQIVSIDVSVTRSETEALLLESSLIKALKPKYNVLMRDDKSYPFIHISGNPQFPRISVIRCKKKPKTGDYFGPYPSATAVRETLNIIQKIFNIRNCSESYFAARSRPCLQYQIKRCSAPCVHYISSAHYLETLKDAKRFLQGKSQQILDEFEKEMQEAVDKLQFEEAASIRDKIKNLRLVQEQQGMVQSSGDADVIVLEARPGFACVLCVHVRGGDILGSETFFPSVPKEVVLDEFLLWQQVFEVFIAHYYLDMPSRIPAQIVTTQDITDLKPLEDILSELRGKSCKIKTSVRGKGARWIDFALNNLRLSITKHDTSASIMRARYQALQEWLHLSKPIKRMECFDISHTQGSCTVASCVVFDEQGSSKRNYRRFNITNITPGDDYAAIEQALIRHLKRIPEKNLPDILVIDGGKGQVQVAQRVLDMLQITSVTLLGIAKGPGRKAGRERLILALGQQEKTLPEDSKALHLLQQIRDEAHRFAITGHRKQRQKTSFESSLERIAGIGPKRRLALLARFGGLRELARASIDEIAKVHGISQALAIEIYQHFR